MPAIASISRVSRGLLRWWTTCSAVCATAIAASSLPIEFHDTTGEWNPAYLQHAVAPNIELEMLVSHRGGKERIYVFSSQKGDNASDAPTRFAHALKSSFDTYRSNHFTEQDRTALGFSGRELLFDLVNPKQAVECRLFAFSEGNRSWAVMQTTDEPPLRSPAFAPLRKNRAPPAGVVKLEPYRVKSNPLTSFPIGLEIRRGRLTNQVEEIFVLEVPPGSTTEQAGVKPGDLIISINGRKAQEFRGGVSSGTELGKIFLNRSPGHFVELELIAADSHQPYSATLRIPTFYESFGPP